ncbi:MAG: cytochrome c [Pseudonocardiales bacterium]|nr:cytochrome c [Pseudonocardiales bacterium]
MSHEADPSDAGESLGFDEADFDFTPAVEGTPVTAAPRRRAPGKRGFRRRLTGFAIVVGALVTIGGSYALLAPSSGAADTSSSAADIEAGRLLYNTTCITCHGQNLQGVLNRGPDLIGVGGASTYFQVSTGRMPAVMQSANEERKPSKFTEEQVRQLSAFVQSVGGGANVPAADAHLRTTTDAQLSEGGELFRLNCASCHNFAAKGAPLSAGKIAPSMNEATDAQIYTAMTSGPESMPVFSDNQITPEQKMAIITYVQTLKASADPGGSGLGRLGPVPEGLIIWTVGLGALMVTILWIGNKS